MKYSVIIAYGHVLADKYGRIYKHRKLLFDKIGYGPHRCYWCNSFINWNYGGKTSEFCLVVDHLDNNKGNNSIDNLVPSCHGCNCSRGREDLVQDEEIYVVMNNAKKGPSRHRASLRTCKTCGKEFPHILADKRENRGQYCSKECMYNRHKTKLVIK